MHKKIVRIQPRGGAELLYHAQLTSEEAFLFTRIAGPLTLEELVAISGKEADEILPILERLERAGLIFLFREERGEPPPPVSVPKQERVSATPLRAVPLLPNEKVFGSPDPLSQTSPIEPALWLPILYKTFISRESTAYYVRYPGGEIYALFVQEGALGQYLCNRNDDQLKIGKILQKISGLPDEEVGKVLAYQRDKGGRFGEILIKMGRLTPKELQQTLIFQFKWVIREMLFKGVPESAGKTGNFPPPSDTLRFFLSPWILQIARRFGSRLAQGGWEQGWQKVRWRTNPLGVLGLKLSDLTPEERTLYRELGSPQGVKLETITPPLRAFILSGILDPVIEKEASASLPHWVEFTARTPFSLLGLHWSALPEEVQSAQNSRKQEIQELKNKGFLPAERAHALEREIEEAVKALLDDATRSRLIAEEAPRDQRENMLYIFVDQGMNALLLSQEYKEAREVGERLLLCSFDLPQHRAAGHYILARSLEKLGKHRDAQFHAQRLREIAGRAQAPAEAHLYLAYFFRDQGERRLAEVELARALAKNPALKATL